MNTRDRGLCPRQLLIGIDAGEWNLVSRWVGEGKLPTIGRLIEHGTRAVLSSSAAQLPNVVWPSLYTGMNPGKLERYFYVQYDPQTQSLRHVPDDTIQQKPFWEYLSEAGLRVGIVDAPQFRASRCLNGFQVTNWGAHATKTARSSHPGTLLREIDAHFGRHPAGDSEAVNDNPGALHRLRQQLLAGVRLRGEMNRRLMRDQAWDVFFATFSEPHEVGHHFWHWMDPSFPLHSTKDRYGLADAIEQVYQAVDREIGEMLALAGEGTLAMVFSGHGMGPLYHACWNLPEILDLLGYGRAPAREAPEHARNARVNPWRMLKRVLPGRLQYAIKGILPRSLQDYLIIRSYTGGLRWDGCRAFAIPNNDSAGAIRVSVQGRDRYGVVAPGEEYLRVCREIADAMRELTDPDSGRFVVENVTITHEEFHGPFLDRLPDVIVSWNKSFAWEALHSPRFGTLRLRQQDSRTGSHTPRGFVLAAGPGVPAGMELTGHSISDIAPTVLEMAGVPVPAEMDGQALPVRRAAVSAQSAAGFPVFMTVNQRSVEDQDDPASGDYPWWLG